MRFASDNTSGAAPEIMAAILKANEGYERSYGADAAMARVTDLVREIFEAPHAEVRLVATGTAANALAPDLNAPFAGYTTVLVAATAQAGFVNCLIEGDVVGAAYAGRRRGA